MYAAPGFDPSNNQNGSPPPPRGMLLGSLPMAILTERTISRTSKVAVTVICFRVALPWEQQCKRGRVPAQMSAGSQGAALGGSVDSSRLPHRMIKRSVSQPPVHFPATLRAAFRQMAKL